MIKKTLLTLVLVTAVMLLAGCDAGKRYSADRFDVTWDVQEDGSLRISETVAFRFEGGPFTYVYRDLPTDYSDGIVEIVASMDGKPLTPGTGPGQVEIERDDDIKVTWHFAPTSDATHTLDLTYRALGVVRQEENADLLTWHALPTDYDYRIGASTLRVRWPAGARPVGAPEVRRGQAAVIFAAGEAVFQAGPLKSDAPLLVDLRFAPGSLISAPPAWQAHAAAARAAAPPFVIGAALLLVAGLIGLLAFLAGYRRDVAAASLSAFKPTAPPDGLPPAIAGMLNATGAQASWANALGTLFDLARRGALRINDLGPRKWSRQHDFAIELADGGADLRPHERGLLALLFEDKKGTVTSIKLSDVGGRAASGLSKFNKLLQEELAQAGLLDAERLAARRRLYTIGGVVMALAVLTVAAGLLLIGRYDGYPMLVPASLFVVGIAFLVAGGVFSPLSQRGADAAARWQGFYGYLRDVVRGREPAWDLGQFERYLPYAASYGLVEKWAKAFQKRGGAEIPAWFGGLATAGDAGMGSFVAMTGAFHASGASGGAGGAGGAGGGGGSGAG